MRRKRLIRYVLVFGAATVTVLLFVSYLRVDKTNGAITSGNQRITQATWDNTLHKYVRKKSPLVDAGRNALHRNNKVNSQIKLLHLPKGINALPKEISKMNKSLNETVQKSSDDIDDLQALKGENDMIKTEQRHNFQPKGLKDGLMQSGPKREHAAQEQIDNKKDVHKPDQMCNLKPNVLFGPPFTEEETHRGVDFNVERTITFGSYQVNNHTAPTIQIPKIMHFIWSGDVIPTVFVGSVRSFVKLHPDWDVYFWSLADGERFLRERYARLLPIYRGYKEDVSRSDALRYAVLYHYGGAYFDLDTRWHKSLSPLVRREECIISPEPEEHAVMEIGLRSLLGTAALLCRPEHPMYRFILNQLLKQGKRTDVNIMTIAGPTFLTNVVSYFTIADSSKMTNGVLAHESEFGSGMSKGVFAQKSDKGPRKKKSVFAQKSDDGPRMSKTFFVEESNKGPRIKKSLFAQKSDDGSRMSKDFFAQESDEGPRISKGNFAHGPDHDLKMSKGEFAQESDHDMRTYKDVSSQESDACDETPFDIRIASHELFYDTIKPHIQHAVDETCSEKNTRRALNELRHMCDNWFKRGGMKRTLSSRAFSEHGYFGSYRKYQKSTLVLLQKNRIDNIVPRVKRYPFE